MGTDGHNTYLVKYITNVGRGKGGVWKVHTSEIKVKYFKTFCLVSYILCGFWDVDQLDILLQPVKLGEWHYLQHSWRDIYTLHYMTDYIIYQFLTTYGFTH